MVQSFPCDFYRFLTLHLLLVAYPIYVGIFLVIVLTAVPVIIVGIVDVKETVMLS